jgi:hypothetical protein
MLEVKNKVKKKFNIDFSKGFVDFILKNPFYAGRMLYNGKEYPHHYDSIISRELFDEVQRIKSGYMKKHSKFDYQNCLIIFYKPGCAVDRD